MLQEGTRAKNIKQTHLSTWLERCNANMIDFRNNFENMTIEEKVDFSRRQYYLLYLLNNVLNGKTKLEGVDIHKLERSKNSSHI